MVGLKDEPHMLAPELGQFLGTGTFRGAAAHANGSARGRHHASEDRQQRGLAAARRPNQQRQFAALERQTYALARSDLSRPLASQLDDIDGLDDGFGHRVNTITGSMRVTCRIAAIADTTHMANVSRNSTRVSAGVMMTGNAVSAVA